MRLHSIEIEGFRRHYSTKVQCSDATFLIGANNVGKSSILRAIKYLLNDTKTINTHDYFCILNENGENRQVSDEVVITGEFRNVPEEAYNWIGFNEHRLFKYDTFEKDNESGLRFFYRKTYRPDQKSCTIEMKQFKSNKKEIFSECKTIQDYINNGIDREIFEYLFPNKQDDQNVTELMLRNLEAYGIEGLFNIQQETEWSENPGGISGNVSHRLPKFLLISDDANSEELSGNNGALMETLNELFNDIRNESENFIQAQHYLSKLAEELDPNDDKSDFAKLLTDLNRIVGDIFPETSFSAQANLSDADKVIKPNFDVQLGSNINTSIEYQGSGVIRSAIFAMLRYKSIRENKKKESGKYVRPLLIAFEEPEIYLHPQAAIQMRDTIYDLAMEPENQIICTTHSPYMIDLSKNTGQVLNNIFLDTTTIEHNGSETPIELVSSNPFNVSEAFTNLLNEDQSYVKMLLKIDDNVSRIFFTKNVLIIEGDTEEVVIRETLSRMPEHLYKEFSYNWEVVKARGKPVIIH
ncbi:ATP-dependent endonuclease [Barrientosiimonas marina]|uniref:AAA family ATPase n=1 Tax=Lentibacillus kimchii TaxID=1542911 RepID=A0ABW2UU03_9BACI